MKYTTNLNLKKPDYTDLADIADVNSNMDTIDLEFGKRVMKEDSTLTTTNKTVIGAINETYSKVLEAFQSASSGKTKIATAITGKGVSTNASDTFDTMVANINQLANVTIDGGRVTGSVDFEFGGFSWVFSSLPFEFQGGNRIIYNNQINLLGNLIIDSNTTYKRHYKWNGSTWVSVSTLPFSFYGYSNAIIYKNELHIMGTSNSSDDYQKQHYKWNGSTWVSVSTLPYAPSTEYSVVLYNGEIYALLYYYKLYKWNGSTWTLVNSSLEFESYKMLIYNNEIHVFGSTKHYKWNGSTWVSVSTLPFSFNLSRGIIELFNGKIHMFQYYGYTSDNTSYYYIWDGLTWSKRNDLNFPMDSGSSLIYNNEIYSFDGKVQQKGTPIYSIKQ